MVKLLSMWLGSAALVAASSLDGPLSDLNDKLEAEAKADAKVAEDAKCWCKDVQSVLDDRLRNSDSQISDLEHIRDARFYENVGLNVEVKQHGKQIDDHEQSLQAAGALASKATKAHGNEKEQTKQALKSLRNAIDIVPKGNEVHGVLQGLEDKFAAKLEDAQEEHDRRESQMKDVNEAKQEMLRLAKKSLNSKMRRVADGKVVIAQAKSDIAAFSQQRDSDYSLQASLRSVCDKVQDAATKRIKERQDAVIAISEQKATNAEKAAQKAMSKVMLLKSKAAVTSQSGSCSKMLDLLGESFQGDCSGVKERAEDAKRRADENLAGAKKSAADIMKLMDKSNSIQAGLTKMLSNVYMNSHLATTKGKLAAGIKSKIDALGDTANADKKETPGLFDQLRAKGKESTKADMKVVTSLQMGAATAGKAVVDAAKCE